ncbi:MAG: hypothetical protein KAH17_07075 [Bacteroidales bacterium]|nr:hypothetical protein [Bacteroidales bacterium]
MNKNQKSVLHIFLMAGFLFLTFSCFLPSSTKAQKKIDEWKLMQVIKSEEHSAQKSTLYSAVIPGWGQAYNKKYWKVPIVWAGIGGISYFIYTNHSGYNRYKFYYIMLSEYPDSKITSIINNKPASWDHDDLDRILNNISSFRKNRDLSVIVLLAWWGLNVVDANVDGHFFNFDIDEDLSLNLSPLTIRMAGNRQAVGINLCLNMY